MKTKNHKIVEIRDAEGRKAYQIAEVGHEPSGQIFYAIKAAAQVIRENEAGRCDACGGIIGDCACEDS